MLLEMFLPVSNTEKKVCWKSWNNFVSI